MKHSRVLIIAVAAAALLSAPAFAQMGGGGGTGGQDAMGVPGQHGGAFLKCLGILNLTDTQKADIKAIFEAEKPVLEQLGQTLKTDAQALKAAVEATTPDPCAIGNLLLKVKADREAIKAEMEKAKAAVEALLTPEQKAKLEGCLQSHGGPHSQAILLGEEIGPIR